jgi:hypothetical protein
MFQTTAAKPKPLKRGFSKSQETNTRLNKAQRQMKIMAIANKGGYQSGQMGQTVNLLSFDFGGSNPSPPTSVEV